MLFFCNPASEQRELLTVRRSDDNGVTWNTEFVLEEGPSGYSCINYLSGGQLAVLYERYGHRIACAIISSDPEGPLGVF